MSDGLDRLSRALRQGLPDSDPDAKSRAMDEALKNFDALQENERPARPMSDRPARPGLTDGVFAMLRTLAIRPAMLATTSLTVAVVAVGLIYTAPPATFPPLVEQRATAPQNRDRSVQTEMINGDTADAETPAVMAQPAPALGLQVEKARPAPSPNVAPDSFAGLIAQQAPADNYVEREQDRNQFTGAAPSPVHVAATDPVSTFSVDVDTASWSWIRASLNNGQLPDPDAVRVEEMVNYFTYDYPEPSKDGPPFTTSVSLMQTPWNPGTRLLRIGLQGRQPAVEDRPPIDLVFLIDSSGSMRDANKLPLLKQGFAMMLSRLRPQDRVAIVAYAGSAGQVLAPTQASDKRQILAALDRLQAGGSTAGGQGLRLAYATADAMHEDGRLGRVILATDGDFNVGVSDPDEMKSIIARQRDSGTYLSVLGFGRGNYNDAMMQTLAQNGNGQAAYIDTALEAQKVLVDQLTGALFPIADDVKIQVELNPAAVAEYRLIGYETRALRREDFNNDHVDAGEIGAGLSVTALYEVTPVGSDAALNDPLRYGAQGATDRGDQELAFLRLRYKEPGQDDSKLIEHPIANTLTNGDTDARFAAAIAGFGELLRESPYVGDWGYEDAAALAAQSRGPDPWGYRSEALRLIRQAGALRR